jgi:hypothetical protein
MQTTDMLLSSTASQSYKWHETEGAKFSTGKRSRLCANHPGAARLSLNIKEV